MATGFVASEDDAAVIRRAIGIINNLPVNARNRPPVDLPDLQTTDVYVAHVEYSGIPAMTMTGGSGTGSPALHGDVPGSGQCDVYRRLPGRMIPVGLSLTVYNYSAGAIAGSQWIPVAKDKFGDWMALAQSVSEVEAPVTINSDDSSTATGDVPLTIDVTTPSTSVADPIIVIRAGSSGAPAAGFGVQVIPIYLKDSGGTYRLITNRTVTLTDVGPTTFTAQDEYTIRDHAATRIWMSVSADGSNAYVNFGASFIVSNQTVVADATLVKGSFQTYLDGNSVLAKVKDPDGNVETVVLADSVGKCSSFTKTSDAALSAITGLSRRVYNGKTYKFKAWLDMIVGAGGAQVDMGGGSATVSSVRVATDFVEYDTGAAGTTNGLAATLTAAQVTTGFVKVVCIIEGMLTASSSGDVCPRFAQNTSNAIPSMVDKGWFSIEEIP